MTSLPTVNLIGPGRLGRSLGRLLAGSGAFRLLGVAGNGPIDEAMQFIGAGEAMSDFAMLPPADFWLVTVSDGAIAGVAAALAAGGHVTGGAVVAHCSGAGSAELLAPLRQRGAVVGSLHPVFSFADPSRAVQTFAGTPCAVEGDDAACDRLEALARAIGGRPFRLAPGGKAAYHAALCVASNYLVSLAESALNIAHLAGMQRDQALPLITGLMQQTLANVATLGPPSALTGPIVRGDGQTVAAHLAALTAHPELLATYRQLGLATLAVAADRLPCETREALRALLAPSA